MQTSCPACRTTFRVSQYQLGQRRGLVRCGSCNAVFNAYDTLLPELEEAPASSLPDVGTVEDGLAVQANEAFHAESFIATTPMPDESPLQQSGENQVNEIVQVQALDEADRSVDHSGEPGRSGNPESTASAPSSEMEGGLERALERTADPDSVDEKSDVSPTPSPSPSPGAATAASVSSAFEAESSEAILLSDLPNRLRDARKPLAWWKRGLYYLTIVLLVLTLLLQLAYFLRAELAAAWPASRPLLNALCKPLGCVVPLPKQLTRQVIASSSLEHDPEQKSRVRLTLLLANRTDLTQAWPHIVLTLSDVRESPVAQRAFSPNEYLPRSMSERAGFPPQSEQEAAVEMDLGSLVASSYLLDVKYP